MINDHKNKKNIIIVIIMIIKTVVRMISLIFFFVDKLISVFSNEWILTAAHCVDGTGPAEIQVGYFFLGIINKNVS